MKDIRTTFILKSLYEIEDNWLDSNQLVKKFYEEHPDKVEIKRLFYIKKNEKRSEDRLYKKLRGELIADAHSKRNKAFFRFENQKWNKKYDFIRIILTEEGKKYYEEHLK